MEKGKQIVVLTGAGISAESGLKTFRGPDGLWEGYSVYRVATPEAWERDPATVLRFYNERRRQVRAVEPNAAHRALAELESAHRVRIITQNVDNLHERAGSSDVLHLHGELMKARSSVDSGLVYDLGEGDIEIGDTCERGSQLRPHVVWFGEPVTEITRAAEITSEADLLLVIGTSLSVYPAAGLVEMVPSMSRVIVINPEIPEMIRDPYVRLIEETACAGVPPVVKELLK